jgi:uncharacterized Zn finger protein
MTESKPAAPACKNCGEPTRLATVIPKFDQSPTYSIYQCDACGYVNWVVEKTDRD